MKGTKKPRLPAAAPGTGRRNSHVGSTTSPDPEATNGIPPNSSGFQSGMWPVCFHHSALQAWNENPALYWSLQGLASHRPASIGSDRITGHSANAAVASSAGRRGSVDGGGATGRSEERRVGEKGRSRGSPDHLKKKRQSTHGER